MTLTIYLECCTVGASFGIQERFITIAYRIFANPSKAWHIFVQFVSYFHSPNQVRLHRSRDDTEIEKAKIARKNCK